MSTFKEVLANFKKELGNTLQAQKNILDVTQKYIGLLEDAEGGSGSGGIDYSTEEAATGLKWIDGSKIYQKTALIENISISAGGTTDITLSTYFANINKIVSLECVNKEGTAIFPSVNVNSSLSPYSIGLTISKADNHITFTRGSGSSAEISVYITIKYTKS